MNLVSRTLLVAAIAGLLLAGPARAGRIFIQAHGGYSFYNLDDVNDSLDRLNAEAGENLLDHISSGWDVGLHAGYAITGELALGAGYARLSGSSEFSRDGYLVTYDMPADLLEITFDYLPANEKKVRLGAGTTMGMIRSAASWRAADPVEGEQEAVFDGSGFLFAGYGILDATVARGLSLYGQAGFRHAVIGELKVDGETVYNPDSLDDKLRFSYSGFFLRVGVKFQP